MNLTPYLDDIERRLDEKTETAIYEAWRAFAQGEHRGEGSFQAPRRTPSEPSVVWKHVNVNDALADEDLMILSQLERCHIALSTPSDALMIMRANYGVGNIASMFGAKRFVMPREADTLPNVYPMGTDGIRRLLDAPQPDLHAGNCDAIFSIAERFVRIREKYPKIARFVRIDNPDAQGPMDNCELLWGSDMFYAFYDEPELLHALLRRVTDAVRELTAAWLEILPNTDGLASFFGRLGKGEIVLRDDSAMNLSSECFDEFIAPYDGELLQHFGGGIVHFCGRGDHFADRLAKVKGLTCVDMSQPHLNDMEKILSALPDRGICMFCPQGDFTVDGHAAQRVNVY